MRRYDFITLLVSAAAWPRARATVGDAGCRDCVVAADELPNVPHLELETISAVESADGCGLISLSGDGGFKTNL
jgi:hypothetical protein